jgi:hypothetical protein
MHDNDDPDYITVAAACAIIGGAAKPINPSNFYRGVKLGYWDPPEHPMPGVSRVRKGKLIARLNQNANIGGARQK